MEENLLPEERLLDQVKGLDNLKEDSTLYEAVAQEMGSTLLECLEECQREGEALPARMERFREVAKSCRISAQEVARPNRPGYWLGCVVGKLSDVT